VRPGRRGAGDPAALRDGGTARTALLLLLVLLLGGLSLWRSPFSASDLAIVPDSVEYAVGAQRLASLGRYDLEIEGVSLPPRYPPWFSALVLAPAYLLFPDELGIGIVPVLALALAALGAAFCLGHRLSGDFGAVAAALALASFGEFRRLSREIMSDVPALAFGLFACALYARMRRAPVRTADHGLAGLLCAAAFALRLELGALLLPFAALLGRRREGGWRRAALLVAPAAAVALATALYNHATFGSWARTGYHFWVPLRADYRALWLSPSFLPANLVSLASAWGLAVLGLGGLGAASLLWRRSPAVRPVLEFLLLGALPGSLFHLFFFFPLLRFHLLSLAILCALAGAGLAALLPEAARRRAWLAPALLALLLPALPAPPTPPPARRITGETLARETAEDAVVVSAIDPVYLEPLLLRGTRRRVVPLSREVEYASKFVAPERVALPEEPTQLPLPRRAWKVLRRQTRQVCAFTAEEEPERLAAWVREGRPVHLDASRLRQGYPFERLLGDELELVWSARHPWLARFALRRPAGAARAQPKKPPIAAKGSSAISRGTVKTKRSGFTAGESVDHATPRVMAKK